MAVFNAIASHRHA